MASRRRFSFDDHNGFRIVQGTGHMEEDRNVRAILGRTVAVIDVLIQF